MDDFSYITLRGASRFIDQNYEVGSNGSYWRLYHLVRRMPGEGARFGWYRVVRREDIPGLAAQLGLSPRADQHQAA